MLQAEAHAFCVEKAVRAHIVILKQYSVFLIHYHVFSLNTIEILRKRLCLLSQKHSTSFIFTKKAAPIKMFLCNFENKSTISALKEVT